MRHTLRSIASICRGFVVQLVMLYNKSTTNRKPTASPQQKSTTSCRTNSKSRNKLDNLSHSKSTTNPQQVACDNQQVLQQVAQLVVQQFHS